jgi:phospholipid/cholesterol/gamma-HCH transport system substrate-binding protein
MEKTAKYFTVGLFTTITVVFFVGFLIWLQGPHDEQDLKYYTVEFTDSISGLEEGSDVQYKGVKVGKVLKAHLVPGNNKLVRVDIGVDKKTPVRAHTKIVLQTQGITGLVRMEMSTENNDLLMPQSRPGMKYPVLAGQGSQLYKALEDISVITSRMVSITKKVDRFSSDSLPQFTAASQEIKGTASSMRKLSEKLNENPSRLIYPASSHGVEIPQ